MFWACKVMSKSFLLITADLVSLFALGETRNFEQEIFKNFVTCKSERDETDK